MDRNAYDELRAHVAAMDPRAWALIDARERGDFEQEAEIERLRGSADKALAAVQTEAKRLQAENERLRRIIADLIEGETAEEGTPQWYALRNARAALGGHSGPPSPIAARADVETVERLQRDAELEAYRAAHGPIRFALGTDENQEEGS